MSIGFTSFSVKSAGFLAWITYTTRRFSESSLKQVFDHVIDSFLLLNDFDVLKSFSARCSSNH